MKAIDAVLGSLLLVGSESLMTTGQGKEATHSVEDSSLVQITTDKSSYSPGEPIVVTVINNFSVPIYALTGQTYCTIITVQRRVNGQWKPEGRCFATGPPGWVSIAPGDRSVVTVRPSLPSDQALASNRHRIVFTFKPKSTEGKNITVFSAEFRISGVGPVPSTNNFTRNSHLSVQIAETKEG